VTEDGVRIAIESRIRLKRAKVSYSSEEMDDEQLAMMDDLEMLREDLVGELEAIDQHHGIVLVL
jgi:hypothetical protein